MDSSERMAGLLDHRCASMPDFVRTRTYTADIQGFSDGNDNYRVTLYGAAFSTAKNQFLARITRTDRSELSLDLNDSSWGDDTSGYPALWVYLPNGHWLQISGGALAEAPGANGRIDANGSGSVWYSDDSPYANMPKYCSLRLTFTRR